MANAERFEYLLAKYLNDTIAAAERAEFFALLGTNKFDSIMDADLKSSLEKSDDLPTEPLSEEADERILTAVMASDKVGGLSGAKNTWMLSWRSVAAAAIFLIGLSVYFYTKSDKPGDFSALFISNSRQRVRNTTALPLAVVLTDGSHVTLQPRSSLYYSPDSFAAGREVLMEGEALFNIAKDSLHPFCVYYGNIVTKVLGTSFTIRTNRLSGRVEVAVLTGKVKVYENEKMIAGAKGTSGVVVTPNQQAVYRADKRLFAATLVEKPVLLKANTDTVTTVKEDQALFDFDNAKLSGVFKSLEAAYGIRINVSTPKLYNCSFSGDITKQDLYDKLRIICLATASEYKINGTEILVEGQGCNETRTP